MITDYASLKSAVADWLNRQDLTSVIPDFISLAEEEFNRTLRVRDMVLRKQASLSSGDQFVAVPTDFLEVQNIELETSPPRTLYATTAEEVDRIRAEKPNGGTPVAFALVASTFELAPVPNAALTLELNYFSKIPSLSDTNTTNWLLTKWPSLYLQGALRQAGFYLDDPELVSRSDAEIGRLLQAIKVEDERSRMRGPTKRVRRRVYG